MKTKLLGLLCTCLIIAGCNHKRDVKPIDDQLFGMKFFNYPRNSFNPGTIYTLTKSGAESIIDKLPVIPAEGGAEIPEYSRNESTDFSVIASFAKTGMPLGASLAGGHGNTVDVSIAIKDAKENYVTQKQLMEQKTRMCEASAIDFFGGSTKAYVIQNVISAKSIDYKFSSSSKNSAEMKATIKEIAEFNPTWKNSNSDKLILSGKFETPLNVLFTALPLGDCKNVTPMMALAKDTDQYYLGYFANTKSYDGDKAREEKSSEFIIKHNGTVKLELYKNGKQSEIYQYSVFGQLRENADGAKEVFIDTSKARYPIDMAINVQTGKNSRWVADAVTPPLVEKDYEIRLNGEKVPPSLVMTESAHLKRANFYVPLIWRD